MTSREDHLVELVDSHGGPVGAATVEQAHQPPGELHRAFSVFLSGPDGRLLLQQRASAKTRFPLRWANTCCGHPAPGEDLAAAAGRRLTEEIGVEGVSLVEAGLYTYRAQDPDTLRVEHEYDHVLIGDLPGGQVPRPDPAEVAALRWVDLAELRGALAADPESYAPWLAGVAECLARYLRRGEESAGDR
ncbi:isopentenyl-diphosphate Delta-isomerase [Krasilnikovia sp. MM14-A1259]|uniref:isopentenyl-diphosphate Delta-isomerase n=1 Tax=Krasilnikovia sp. MM14-A1259 TaxID=3373539 RepID=UPI00382A8FE1